MHIDKRFLMLAAGMTLAATPAWAQNATPTATADKVEAGENAAVDTTAKPEAEAPKGAFDLSIGFAAVSDYRFRGISLSDKKAAVQPSITLTHKSGFHIGAWGSNITPNDGDDIELDLVAGYGTTVGPITFDVNATRYIYPGVQGIDYWEIIGTASHEFGPVTIGGTFAYTPKQGDAAPKRGLYYAINGAVAIPKTPLTATASFGIEDNGFYSNKRDWSVGLAADVAGFSVGAAWVDTGHVNGDPLGKGRAVFSISRTFDLNF